jgi:hypothetical protein
LDSDIPARDGKTVYIRQGGVTPLLTTPYAGPYAVLEPGDKTV